jgi:hypothetical protein
MEPEDAEAFSILMRAFAPWLGPYWAREGVPPPLHPHLFRDDFISPPE